MIDRNFYYQRTLAGILSGNWSLSVLKLFIKYGLNINLENNTKVYYSENVKTLFSLYLMSYDYKLAKYIFNFIDKTLIQNDYVLATLLIIDKRNTKNKNKNKKRMFYNMISYINPDIRRYIINDIKYWREKSEEKLKYNKYCTYIKNNFKDISKSKPIIPYIYMVKDWCEEYYCECENLNNKPYDNEYCEIIEDEEGIVFIHFKV